MSINYIIDQKATQIIYDVHDIMYSDFERCTFEHCDFTTCDFTGTSFIDCIFISCNFNESRINYVAFRDVSFTDCNFTGVNFVMVDKLIFGVNFTNCVLDYAKFYTLKLKGTLFCNCSITAADFMESDLTDAVFLTTATFTKVYL